MKRNDVKLILSLLLITLFLTPSSRHGNVEAAETKKQLLAGAYAMDITPEKFPVSMNGGMTNREAIGAHDTPYARCLVLDDGTEKIAIVITDFCMVPREIFDAAKKKAAKATGIPESNILTSATHTHTAVVLASTFQSYPTELEDQYIKYLVNKIAEGIKTAHDQREPAKIGWAVGNNPNQVFNRRWYMRKSFSLAKADPFGKGTDKVRMNPPGGSKSQLKPSGPIDPEVPIVSVQALDGRPIALLANYSLHYVGGVPANLLSADYFGEFARQFARMIGADKKDEKSKHPPFVAMMSNGTSGNINNINFFEPRTRKKPFEQITIVAADVASSAYKAYQRIEYYDSVPVKMLEKEIELGVRIPNEEDIAFAKSVLEKAGEEPYRDRTAIYARETMLLSKYPKTVKVKLQAIRIGGLGIVSTPFETFVETGLAIKKKSPLLTTFTIELANGYNGYLPTPEHHKLGGYETWRAQSSFVTEDSEPIVRKTLLDLLNQLAD